jgi:magnesium-transporting ATPase (P-type)
MGITGTEVAKSAAKIVITDDNFATIVGAIEQGRVVYGNLKKVCCSCSPPRWTKCWCCCWHCYCGYPLPLAAVQILWINIVTEGTVTVNLVMDPPGGRRTPAPPIPKNEPLVTRPMLHRLLLMVSTSVIAIFGFFHWRLAAGVPV